MHTKILNYFIDHKESLFLKGDLKLSTHNDIIRIKKLFPYSETPKKTSQIIQNIQWILSLDDSRFVTPFGLYKDKNIIIYFDQEGLLRFACHYIQDLPFFYYPYATNFFTPQETKDKHIDSLNKYMHWCNSNNILVDEYSLFLDQSNNLLEENLVDDYEEENYNIFFPSIEEQVFKDE